MNDFEESLNDNIFNDYENRLNKISKDIKFIVENLRNKNVIHH